MFSFQNCFLSNYASVNSKRYHSPLRATPGHLTKVMPGGPGFAHTNRPGGQNLTGAGNLQKIQQHMGLIPTQNCFFGIHYRV